MRHLLWIPAVLIAFPLLVLAQTDAAKPEAPAAEPAVDKGPFKTLKERVSYAIGLNIGRSMKDDNADLDPDLIAAGIRDMLEGKEAKLSAAGIQAAMMEFQQDMATKRAEAEKVAADKNLADGKAFLADNSKKEGVVSLPSGLQYKIITKGEGPKPGATDNVKAHYRGTLLDGTEFDSSYKRGQPATFALDRVIKGWTEALQLMPVGSKWTLYIPSEIAYGATGTGRGGPIGPNATLIFEVELLGIEKAAAGQ